MLPKWHFPHYSTMDDSAVKGRTALCSFRLEVIDPPLVTGQPGGVASPVAAVGAAPRWHEPAPSGAEGRIIASLPGCSSAARRGEGGWPERWSETAASSWRDRLRAWPAPLPCCCGSSEKPCCCSRAVRVMARGGIIAQFVEAAAYGLLAILLMQPAFAVAIGVRVGHLVPAPARWRAPPQQHLKGVAASGASMARLTRSARGSQP